MANEFVLRESDRITLALRDQDRNDFVVEATRLLRSFCLVLRGHGKLVLRLTRDAVFLGDVLGGDAHVVLVVDVPQPVHNHRVDELRVAHAETVARTRQYVRCGGHVLLATGHDDIRVARNDGVGCQHHGLQT